MQQPIGELIRQARRQLNLTQSELGGERYSKSYVSVVERGKIEPSPEALRFFAEQLGQPSDYFQNMAEGHLFLLNEPSLYSLSVHSEQSISIEELTFLDMLLENIELTDLPSRYELPVLSQEVIISLPPQKQARYYFLLGRISQEKHDLIAALHAFEHALGLATARYQPAILDELGTNYYLRQAYQSALGYHLRALDLLKKEAMSNASPSSTTAALRCKIEIHCGNDYRALGAYSEACQHYEIARLLVNAEHDIKSAGALYQGLGFCTYAVIEQKTACADSQGGTVSIEEMEREFQRAVGYLLQSRILYQVSSDSIGEATARLTLAVVMLDHSRRRRQIAEASGRKDEAIKSASFLSEAEEQCHQVLLNWRNVDDGAEIDLNGVDGIIYVALAYLIRIFVQRATFAQLGGYTDTASRERAMAAYLCQQVLSGLTEDVLPWATITAALALQTSDLKIQALSLPRLPDLSASSDTHSLIGLTEVYFAAGEVAEELGRIATEHDYALECYSRADSFFQEALSLSRAAITMGEREPGYLMRCYQRCICILEERMVARPDLWQEVARSLLDILKEGLIQLQYPIFPSFKVAEAS